MFSYFGPRVFENSSERLTTLKIVSTFSGSTFSRRFPSGRDTSLSSFVSSERTEEDGQNNQTINSTSTISFYSVFSGGGTGLDEGARATIFSGITNSLSNFAQTYITGSSSGTDSNGGSGGVTTEIELLSRGDYSTVESNYGKALTSGNGISVTIETYASRFADINGSTNITYSSFSQIGGVAGSGVSSNQTISPNTNSLRLAPGWIILSGYRSSTQAVQRTFIWPGSSLIGTGFSYIEGEIPSTLEDPLIGTTTYGKKTNVTTSFLTTRTLLDTVLSSTTSRITVWNNESSITRTSATTYDTIQTTTRFPSAGEQFTNNQTVYLYAEPVFTNPFKSRFYSQAIYLVANTTAGESIWSGNGLSAFGDDGTFTSSTFISSFETFESAYTNPKKTTSGFGDFPKTTLTLTLYNQRSGTINGISTVAGSATGYTTTVLTSQNSSVSTRTLGLTESRTLSSTSFGRGTYRTSTREYDQDGFEFITSPRTSNALTLKTGTTVFLRENNGALEAFSETFNALAETGITESSYKDLSLLAVRTFETSGSSFFSSFIISPGRSSTQKFVTKTIYESVDNNILLSRNFIAPVGLLGQIPNPEGWSVTAGLGFGGMESFYELVRVDGSALIAPLVDPLTKTASIGGTFFSYFFQYSDKKIYGTSFQDSVSNTFSSSFSLNSVKTPFSYNEAGVFLIGNNEKWSGDKGYIYFNRQNIRINPAVIFVEENNQTSKINVFLNGDNFCSSVDARQSRIERNWAAINGFGDTAYTSTYQYGITAPAAVATFRT
jgi:hypothetical protein